jgi:hypothetical protein
MTVSLEALTFDCADAVLLGEFWSAVLEHPVDPDGSEDFTAIGLADGNKLRPAWMFIKVPEAKTAKNRFHPDLTATDHQAEVERLIGLGAKRVGDFDEAGAQWTTLADPEGNEFDIVAA